MNYIKRFLNIFIAMFFFTGDAEEFLEKEIIDKGLDLNKQEKSICGSQQWKGISL